MFDPTAGSWTRALRWDGARGMGLGLLWLALPAVGLAWLRLVGAPVQLGFWEGLQLALLGPGLAGGLLAGPGLAAGMVRTLRRWADEGAMLALRIGGWGPASVLRGLWPLVTVWVVCAGLVGLWLEPIAWRSFDRALQQHPAALRLSAGQRSPLGTWTVWTGDADRAGHRLWLSGEGIRGTAEAARLEGRVLATGPVTVLLAGERTAVVRAASARVPLSPPPHRLPLAARSTRELVEVARRTERSGGQAAYEWAVVYKRLWSPVQGGLWALLAVGIGQLRRPWWLLAGATGLWWAATRAGDALAASLGAAPASLTGPVVLALLVGLVWRRVQ